ncbi:MAG: hypothetical protein R2827_06320 [Bdellovibrionales bacterium]
MFLEEGQRPDLVEQIVNHTNSENYLIFMMNPQRPDFDEESFDIYNQYKVENSRGLKYIFPESLLFKRVKDVRAFYRENPVELGSEHFPILITSLIKQDLQPALPITYEVDEVPPDMKVIKTPFGEILVKKDYELSQMQIQTPIDIHKSVMIPVKTYNKLARTSDSQITCTGFGGITIKPNGLWLNLSGILKNKSLKTCKYSKTLLVINCL